MATVITTVTQLQNMQDDLTADYELGGNINAVATSGWNGGLGFDPIGTLSDKFTGHFDGKGYKITSLTIARPAVSWVGLFAYTNGGEIKNVGLEDCSVSGERFVGALAGGGGGDGISDCWSTGTVDSIKGSVGGLLGYSYAPVSDCYSTCAVTSTGGANGTDEVGGLIGTIANSVTRSYATGNVIATSDGNIEQIGGFVGLSTAGKLTSMCYATGDVDVTAGGTAESIGGFVGDGGDDTSNCYARGDITVSAGDTSLGRIGGFIGLSDSPTITNCYSTGSITETIGIPYVGGFCGDNYGTITNCFWDTETSGQGSSDGGTGKTTAQMKTKSTFTDAGWDFATVWSLMADVNSGYPSFLGSIYPDTLTAGNFAIVETRLHYMGTDSVERYIQGLTV